MVADDVLDCWHFHLSTKHNPLAILILSCEFAVSGRLRALLGALFIEGACELYSFYVCFLISMCKFYSQGKGRYTTSLQMEKKWQKNMTWKQMNLLVNHKCFVNQDVTGRYDSIAINLMKCLSVRRWRYKNAIGAVGQWQVEVGEPIGGPDTSCSPMVIKENCSNVSFPLCFLKI